MSGEIDVIPDTNKSQIVFPRPTAEELAMARKIYGAKEPRDLFYRVATEMIKLAIQEKTSFSVAEALAALLQTWNKRYYNKNRPFNNQHLSDIERVVQVNRSILDSFRKRFIETFSDSEKPVIKRVFEDFDKVIGPVGTAKSLHLFAPRFFPIWDSAIAEKYHLALIYGAKTEKHALNAERYICFMEITKSQCETLAQGPINDNLLKAIDEYNYCRFSKEWL